MKYYFNHTNSHYIYRIDGNKVEFRILHEPDEWDQSIRPVSQVCEYQELSEKEAFLLLL